MDWPIFISLFGTFFLLLFIGLPISYSIGLSTVLSLIIAMDGNVGIAFSTISQKMVSGLDNFGLLALPFFILAGNIMNRGGLATRLINFAQVLSGKLPGSLLQCNVIANMLFGSLSGSAVASAAAVGGIMTPLQRKEGYDPRLSAAVNIASAPVGLLIPPSNTFIVFSLVSGGTSVAALFLAGYLPGILWGLSIMFVAAILAYRRGYRASRRPTFSEVVKYTFRATPSLLLIIVVMGGIVKGFFTPTEASAVAVVYCLFLTMLYKELSLKELPKIILESAVVTAIVLLLISVSMGMSYVMAFSGLPYMVSDTLLSISDNPIIILLIINLILLVIGCFMDMTPAVLIFTPIFFPIAVHELGMDPIHFGVMMVFNLCVGIITPPIGSALFVGCSIADVPLTSVLKPLIPLILVVILMLLITAYVPSISLMLPRYFGY